MKQEQKPQLATSQVDTVTTGADKAKLGAAVALVIAALAGFYLLAKQGQVAQWGALIVGLVSGVGFSLLWIAFSLGLLRM